MALIATKAYGGQVEASISYTVSPVHTTDYFVEYGLKLEQEGADQIAIKDMAGLLYPTEAVKLFRELRTKLTVPLTCHSHSTTGVGTLNAVIAMQTGLDYIDTAITPFAGGTSHPPVEVLIVFAEELGLDHGLDKSAILKAQEELFNVFSELSDYIDAEASPASRRPVHYKTINRETVREIIALVKQGCDEDNDAARASLLERALTLMHSLLHELGYPPHKKGIFKSQIPGGMLSNLQNQLKQMGQLDRIDQIMQEIPEVRRDVGYVPLVTPTSQIIGSQATFNVMLGQRYQMVSNEFKMLLRGEFGHTPAPINPEVIQKVLDPGETPLKYRPASYLPPVLEDEYPLPFIKSHKDLLLHLMLKQPADEFLKQR
jgi:pyruvate/oxaloacetate carboxyltransferase